ncbi:RNA polymerase sigma factor [Mycobacterium sp.]|uniref:RNA polymerase sigma factor n=1 Tax=Mycobacterium sp. TaxID=1785 RepID=UPI002DA89AB3|nr:sigma-70 family RNA polymerase sigma factor [Mycobacterium sp.]
MTAAANWDVVGPAETDAELARAAAAGDREAFAGIYDRYADRLHDFCVGMLRDRDGAADCVQDTFCTAATRLSQLRDADKLRPWLYSIARNEALRRIRERRRESLSDELPDVVSHDPGPDTLAARTELADLITEAAGGLSDRDRSVLELAYRHGLDGDDLADALGVSPANATKMVYRLRETIERSLGALLVSRRVRNTGEGCAALAAILDGWDGRFSMLMRKRIARHIESCPTCDEQRRHLVSPVVLLGGAPMFIPAPAWLRERTLSKIQLTPSTTPIEAGPAPSRSGETQSIPVEDVDDTGGRRTRRVLLVVALFAATLIASLGLTIAWQQQKTTPVVPVDMSGTATQPVSATPGGQSSDKSSPIPAPPAVSTATTTPAASVPPDAETTPVRTPVVSAPPPRLEPDSPVSEPVPPPPPVSEPPAPRTRSSAPADSSVPRTTRPQAPPGIAGIPTQDPDPPKRTATRRSTDGPSRG